MTSRPPTSTSQPEGYATLAVLEEHAPNYNAWLGRRLASQLGNRVLEVGAGIGTMTREILPGRDLVIALEAEATYACHLRQSFKHEPRLRIVHCSVEQTDWASLAAESLDSVLLSNVLEHIEDDRSAILNFRKVLPVGGRLVLLVPALPSLFGSLDEAVGHFRRYTPTSLTKLLEGCRFRVERVEWINMLGIPGWFLNGRLLKRRVLPAAQIRFYDTLAPFLARLESALRVPIGLSLLSVGRAV